MSIERCSRRALLARAGLGLGALALGGLPAPARLRADEPRGPSTLRAPHHPAKATAVIWLYMEGGPSGFDLFDPKPELQQRGGQRVDGIETHFGNPGPLLPSPFAFRQHGRSGLWMCDQYPTLAEHVDELAVIRSLHADSPNHSPAMYQMNTGFTRPGFPSLGSWLTYGLGSVNQDFPGFVVLGGSVMKGGALNWGSGFLPSSYQGTLLRTAGQPILDLARPAGLGRERQQAMLDLAAALDGAHLRAHPGEADLAARTASFALAQRMQATAPELCDLAGESAETRALYGLDRGGGTRQFGEKCLLARRMIERGVRMVQVYSNDEWDAHGDLAGNHRERCRETDVPIAGLLTDLKRRGLLDSTLVVYGGEFGRMPVSEGGKGRDHNPHGFCAWLAGAGVKGGTAYGETDELGWKAARDPVSVPDFHATILHLLGLDHERLVYEHNGRRFRLTDVSGRVVAPLLA
jgi:uncharacterized protein (DUF1501 family)